MEMPRREPMPAEWYAPPRPAVRSRRPPRLPWVHLGLFAATFATTAIAGALQMGVDPFSDPAAIRAGFPFAVTLMTILLVHELGHYFVARYHGVQATLPYFIPAPPLPVGTFGAFIRMKSPPETRRALFDVGAAGPWAGIIFAIPAVIIGLHLSTVHLGASSDGGLILGDSLLFSLLTRLTLGVTPETATISLHPIAMAGWFGFLVTFLNLLPVGQLDGGHVAYAMFGRWHRWVSRLFVGVILVLGFSGWAGWFVWAILVSILGLDHPPTVDLDTGLDRRRMVAAWLTVGVFILTFMPVPISVVEPRQLPQFEGPALPVHTRPLHAPHPGPLPFPAGSLPEAISV